MSGSRVCEPLSWHALAQVLGLEQASGGFWRAMGRTAASTIELHSVSCQLRKWAGKGMGSEFSARLDWELFLTIKKPAKVRINGLCLASHTAGTAVHFSSFWCEFTRKLQ